LKLSPEELLLRWVNYQLRRSQYSGKPVANFSGDIKVNYFPIEFDRFKRKFFLGFGSIYISSSCYRSREYETTCWSWSVKGKLNTIFYQIRSIKNL
jgi:hypothetical protein